VRTGREIEFLRKFHDEVSNQLGAELLNHKHKKQRGARKKEHSAEPDVSFGFKSQKMWEYRLTRAK